jgi:hypothetical protein
MRVIRFFCTWEDFNSIIPAAAGSGDWSETKAAERVFPRDIARARAARAQGDVVELVPMLEERLPERRVVVDGGF